MPGVPPGHERADRGARLGVDARSGPLEGWPQSLQTAVRIVLGSRFAMWMAWGPELTFFYNDAYARDTLASKHPWALGQRADAVWAEIWDDIGPRIEQVMATGTATWDAGLRLFLRAQRLPRGDLPHVLLQPAARRGRRRRPGCCAWSSRRPTACSASGGSPPCASWPRPTGSGLRRARPVRRRRPQPGRQPATTCRSRSPTRPATAGTLDARRPPARRPGRTPRGSTAAPAVVDLAGRRCRPGAWEEPPRQALAIALADSGRPEPAGLLVAGLNPYRALDQEYRGFLELVAGQIASSLASVRAREAERERAEALAELDRAKTDFFSNVSHEFRTPLSLILGPAEDALAEAGDGEQRGAPERRLPQRAAPAEARQQPARVLAHRGRQRRAGARADRPRRFTDRPREHVPRRHRPGRHRARGRAPATSPLVARVDREMWERIVLNLVSNAFKFTFEGEIRVALRRDGADAVLTRLRHRHRDRRRRALEPVRALQARARRALAHARGQRHRPRARAGARAPARRRRVRGERARRGLDVHASRVPLEEAGAAAGRAATPTSGAAAYLEEALRWLPDAEDSVGELEAVGAGVPADAARRRRGRGS